MPAEDYEVAMPDNSHLFSGDFNPSDEWDEEDDDVEDLSSEMEEEEADDEDWDDDEDLDDLDDGATSEPPDDIHIPQD